MAIGSEAVSNQLGGKVKPLIVRPKLPIGRKYLRHARHWGVGRIRSWSNHFRKLLMRFEKNHASYEGLQVIVTFE